MTGYHYDLHIANITGETPEYRRAFLRNSYFANPVSQGDTIDVELNNGTVACEVKRVRHPLSRSYSTIEAVTQIPNKEFDEIFEGFMQSDASQPSRR